MPSRKLLVPYCRIMLANRRTLMALCSAMYAMAILLCHSLLSILGKGCFTGRIYFAIMAWRLLVQFKLGLGNLEFAKSRTRQKPCAVPGNFRARQRVVFLLVQWTCYILAGRAANLSELLAEVNSLTRKYSWFCTVPGSCGLFFCLRSRWANVSRAKFGVNSFFRESSPYSN